MATASTTVIPTQPWSAPDRATIARAQTGACGLSQPVLMICQAFPPTGGPGVQRSAKFAKYLPRSGWQPVVWSATHLRQLPEDGSLLTDLPNELTHYRSRPLTHASIHEGFMRPLKRIRLEGPRLSRMVTSVDWRVERGLRWFASRMIPDECVVWALSSVLPLLRVIRRERIKLLYSTYSPISNHLLARWLKRLTGLPWVADYRDLWIDDFCYSPRSRVRGWVERRLQGSLLAEADAVVGVSPGQTDVLARHVPSQRSKFFTVSNGVDHEDFDRIDRPGARERIHGPPGRFLLTFTGLFVSNRIDAGFLDGLGQFARWVVEQRGRFELRIVGGVSQEMRERLTREGIPLAATGYLPHHGAIEQMIAADVLLLITPSGHNASGFMTGKLFEYLASGRPILLVGPGSGAARKLITDCGAGICVTPRSDQVFTALQRVWSAWRTGSLRSGCTARHLAPYTRQHLAEKLAEIFDNLRSHKD